MPAVTEEQIAALVQTFYDRARAHPDLGKVFNNAVADWDHHLGIVRLFWAHVLLGDKRYNGHPFPVHLSLPIERQHFDQWLSLFRETAAETLPPEAATHALARAEHMAKSFKAGLFPFDRT